MPFNIERAKEVLAKIKEYPDTFDMGMYMSGEYRQPPTEQDLVACNTTCCIAGWAAVLMPSENYVFCTDLATKVDGVNYFETGRVWLGLDDVEADYLFNGCRNTSSISRNGAGTDFLEACIEAGKVIDPYDWRNNR